MQYNEAVQAGLGYAWGMQDAGAQPRDSDDAIMFALAYASIWKGFDSDDCRHYHVPNLRDFYRAWVEGLRTMGKVLTGEGGHYGIARIPAGAEQIKTGPLPSCHHCGR
jgi:hypothetical protein